MKTEFQKCMDGEIFDGKDKELAEMTLKTKRLLVKLNSTDHGGAGLRHRPAGAGRGAAGTASERTALGESGIKATPHKACA